MKSLPDRLRAEAQEWGAEELAYHLMHEAADELELSAIKVKEAKDGLLSQQNLVADARQRGEKAGYDRGRADGYDAAIHDLAGREIPDAPPEEL